MAMATFSERSGVLGSSRTRREVVAAMAASGAGIVAAPAIVLGRERGFGAARPFPQHAPLAAGTIIPSHRTHEQLDTAVRSLYEWWKARYLAPVGRKGRKGYRVRLGAGGAAAKQTVSEGQGYGMVIVATMAGADPDARAIFDGLWKFVDANRSCVDPRLMRWIVPNTGQGCVDAFDGDADIALALLMADAQWGSGGAVNYLAQARAVMAGLLASAVGPRSRYPLLGDWVDPAGFPVGEWAMRTSDAMPAHFRAFAEAGGPQWNAVLAACEEAVATIQRDHSPTTGLLPEFVSAASPTDTTPVPAPDNALEEGGNDDADYGSNACRVPWRLGTHAILNGDAASRAAARKMSGWIEDAAGGNAYGIRYGYRLDGTPLPGSDFFATSFGAPFGVAAMTDPSQQRWLNAVWDAVVATRMDYYEDSIALQCLIAMSGNGWGL